MPPELQSMNLPPEFVSAIMGNPASPSPLGQPPAPMQPQLANPFAGGIGGPPASQGPSFPYPEPMGAPGGQMGSLGGGMGGMFPGGPPAGPMDPAAGGNVLPPAPQMTPGALMDPGLLMALQAPPPAFQKVKRPVFTPSLGDIQAYAKADRDRYTRVIERMSRDLSIYRQWDHGTPDDWDPDSDSEFYSAAMSNLVNKLSNMFAGLRHMYRLGSRDEDSEKSAQVVKNFLYHCRSYEKRLYARSSGGSLQRDEFWYLMLMGRLVGRILPDLEDDDYPYRTDLLDPATCFPYFGDAKEGMMRMTRVYNEPLGKIISTYGGYNRGLLPALMAKLGVTPEGLGGQLYQEGEVVEYWDDTYRAVTYMGIEVIPIMEHGLGRVPFAYVMAVGEPVGMTTPNGRYSMRRNLWGNVSYVVNRDIDAAEKGVSVFHYLVNTHRLKEALGLLLYEEVEKRVHPPTITYVAPHLAGKMPPPLDTNKRANNQRLLNLQKVEPIPTSPSPSDVSPVMQMIGEDLTMGGYNPALAGGGPAGASPSGASLDTLVGLAKDLAIPYLQAWEAFQGIKSELKLIFYRDIIGELVPMAIPMKKSYGGYSGTVDLKVTDIRMTGTLVEVEMKNISEQNLPGLANTAINLEKAGLWDERYAMDYIGVEDPDSMQAGKIMDLALQNQSVMDLFQIPMALEARGAPELARFWVQYVIMPGLLAGHYGPITPPGGMGGPPGVGGAPGAPPGLGGGPGGPPSLPPNTGGQSLPTQQLGGQRPGGPPVGQGRGIGR